MALMQLTIDGREVPHAVVALASGSARHPLTAGQREILELVRDRGCIRSVEAGVAIHRARNHCAFGARSGTFTGRGIGCCSYASADGLAAMKRLMHRGLVYRDESRRGYWLPA